MQPDGRSVRLARWIDGVYLACVPRTRIMQKLDCSLQTRSHKGSLESPHPPARRQLSRTFDLAFFLLLIQVSGL